MFQVLVEPKFAFMKWGRTLLGVSVVLMIASVIILLTHGLNFGIEFTGGTELQVKYAERPDVGRIRDLLAGAGLTSQVVTEIGDPAEHEVYIRLGSASNPEVEEDLTSRVANTLRAEATRPDGVDLNVVDEDAIEKLLLLAPDLSAVEAGEVAAAVIERRQEAAIFHSLDELGAIGGVTPAVLDYLREKAYVGPLAVRSQSYIGPAIGKELMQKARLAITLSLIMMLIYIWLRFEFQWGLAAVLALVHDTLVTLGLFSLFNMELSLPVVAAFLTLVGYSVNDTVVVFDRIRENLRNRATASLEDTIDLSINQTLSRTAITSGLTWVVVLGLYLFGGAALRSFAFVLTAGVMVGTYSSIYIASPLLALWRQVGRGRGAARAAATAGGGAKTAKKLRGGGSGRA